MTVIYHPAAEEEVVAAVTYYETQVAGLGIRFIDDLDKTIEDVANSPKTWILLEDGIRRHQFTHFPFAVLYKLADSQIRVLAVMNLHREPGYWKNRV